MKSKPSKKDKTMNLQQFEQLLKNHDWSYMMSEDSRYYRKGQQERDEIYKAIDEYGDEFRKLYEQYNAKFGVWQNQQKDIT